MTITDLTLESVRGFERPVSLKLEPLNVLIGRNGVGKSTIVDALFMGASHNPADALGRTVRRRIGVQHGAKWLLNRSATGGAQRATIRVATSDERVRETRISVLGDPSAILAEELLRRNNSIGVEDIQSLRVQIDDGQLDAEHRATFEVAFEPRNSYAIKGVDVPEALRLGAWLRLVDTKLIGAPLTDAFSRAATDGSMQGVIDLLKESEPGISGLQILTDQEQPYLAATVRGLTVPLTLLGDGMRLLAQMAFEMNNMREGGVLLVEEPELHQHPRALRALAKALVESSRRGVQVVISTHSLDLATAIKSQFDSMDATIPECAWICVERDDAGFCKVNSVVGRNIFSSAEWSRFKDRFSVG